MQYELKLLKLMMRAHLLSENYIKKQNQNYNFTYQFILGNRFQFHISVI